MKLAFGLIRSSLVLGLILIASVLASKIDTVVLDKTGTVTKGYPEVIAIEAINMNNQELLQLAASIEIHSEHPIAKAIVKAAKENNLSLLKIKNLDVQNNICGYSGCFSFLGK